MSIANEGSDDILKASIARNESLAEWGGAAVVFGLLIEVVLTAAFRHGESFTEAWGPVLADILVALGVAAEILFARKARLQAETLQRKSEEKVAAANERAATAIREAEEARERTAQVEKLTAWRRLSEEQSRQIADAIRGEMKPETNIHIEWERGDPEAFSYAFDLHKIFKEAGVAAVSGGGNSWLGWQKFGLWVAAFPGIKLSLIMDAFEKSGIHMNVGELPFGLPTAAQGLYIFVAPKLPLHFDEFAKPGDGEIGADATASPARE